MPTNWPCQNCPIAHQLTMKRGNNTDIDPNRVPIAAHLSTDCVEWCYSKMMRETPKKSDERMFNHFVPVLSSDASLQSQTLLLTIVYKSGLRSSSDGPVIDFNIFQQGMLRAKISPCVAIGFVLIICVFALLVKTPGVLPDPVQVALVTQGLVQQYFPQG